MTRLLVVLVALTSLTAALPTSENEPVAAFARWARSAVLLETHVSAFSIRISVLVLRIVNQPETPPEIENRSISPPPNLAQLFLFSPFDTPPAGKQQMDLDDDLSSLSEMESEVSAPKRKFKGEAKTKGGISPNNSLENTSSANLCCAWSSRISEEVLRGDIELDAEYRREISAVKSNDDGSETRTCIDGKQRLTFIHLPRSFRLSAIPASNFGLKKASKLPKPQAIRFLKSTEPYFRTSHAYLTETTLGHPDIAWEHSRGRDFQVFTTVIYALSKWNKKSGLDVSPHHDPIRTWLVDGGAAPGKLLKGGDRSGKGCTGL
ncbi:hypothetical protein L218DRAFT_1063254 [Marasmius fiardii PR-910]|nr:hypothetical protein L218DRAFT_1063254 [Marasmius fiardii PR-910]